MAKASVQKGISSDVGRVGKEGEEKEEEKKEKRKKKQDSSPDKIRKGGSQRRIRLRIVEVASQARKDQRRPRAEPQPFPKELLIQPWFAGAPTTTPTIVLLIAAGSGIARVPACMIRIVRIIQLCFRWIDADMALGPHPLLAQVPLTVSPFINLPSAVTLPYTYKSVPSTLPPSITGDPGNPEAKTRYVVSASGEHAAHPEEILASCQSLGQHLKKTRADAEDAVKQWEESVRQRDLAEKRKVAPGWLDRKEKILQPSRATPTSPRAEQSLLDSTSADQSAANLPSMKPRDEGEELDQAFGRMGVK